MFDEDATINFEDFCKEQENIYQNSCLVSYQKIKGEGEEGEMV